ncbi:MAG: TorF family putative porin, partial [Acinetobacter sp.]
DFGDEAHLELDPQIGYTAPVTLGSIHPTADIGMLRYNYVGNSDLNYNEYYFKMIFNALLHQSDSLIPSISYTNNYGGKVTSESMGKDISNWYFNVLYATPISQSDFGANASLGYSKASEEIYGSEAEDHFFDWKIGVTYAYKPMGLLAELAAMGSNLTTGGLSDTNKKGVKTAAVFTLTKSF